MLTQRFASDLLSESGCGGRKPLAVRVQEWADCNTWKRQRLPCPWTLRPVKKEKKKREKPSRPNSFSLTDLTSCFRTTMIHDVFYTEPTNVNDEHYHEVHSEAIFECILHLLSKPDHAADIVDAFADALKIAHGPSVESNNKDLR